MVSSSPILKDFTTDSWVKASWEEFVAIADNPAYEKSRGYYHQQYMRIEIAALGPIQGRQNSIIPYVVILFAALNTIQVVLFTNTSFRKVGLGEFQPDLAFYIGSGLRVPPDNSDSPVNLDEYDPPSLVVEIGASYISDDLGWKRLLYERLGVQEYWVINANLREAIAFSIADGRSGEIQQSLALSGLAIAVVREALQRSQTQDDGEINRWLLQIFSQV